MHEQLAIEALIERLSCLQHVREVRVRANVVFSPEALEQAYEMQTLETPLAHSVLLIEARPQERTCRACGHGWSLSADDVAGHVVLCPACGDGAPFGDGAVLEVTGITWGSP